MKDADLEFVKSQIPAVNSVGIKDGESLAFLNLLNVADDKIETAMFTHI